MSGSSGEHTTSDDETGESSGDDLQQPEKRLSLRDEDLTKTTTNSKAQKKPFDNTDGNAEVDEDNADEHNADDKMVAKGSDNGAAPKTKDQIDDIVKQKAAAVGRAT